MPRETGREVLDKITLRFKDPELETFYIVHHWLHASYWLKRAIAIVITYAILGIVMGEDAIFQAMDVRMDHYSKSPVHGNTEEENAQAGTGTNRAVTNSSVNQVEESSGNKIGEKKRMVVNVDEQEIVVEHYGFFVWHLTWSFAFMSVIILNHIFTRKGCLRWWVYARNHLVFVVMFVDLVITAFINPTITRFFLFVYALLIRVSFVQTLVLIMVSSFAVLGAGYVGSNRWLNSVSITEFVVLNVICGVAARQIEIHARLSLYRLWYINMTNDQSENGTPTVTSRDLLSLKEFALPRIPEDEAVVEGEEGSLKADDSGSASGSVGGSVPGSHISSSQYSVEVPKRSSVPNERTQVSPSRDVASRSSNVSVHSSSSSASNRIPLELNPNDIAFNVNPVASSEKSASRSDSQHADDRSVASFQSVLTESQATAMLTETLGQTKEASEQVGQWPCLEGEDRFPRSISGSTEDASSWFEPPAQSFELRGANYLTDKKKQASEENAFALHQVRTFIGKEPMLHVAENLPSLREFLAAHPRQSFFIVVRIVPNGRTTITHVALWVRKLPLRADPAFDSAFGAFREAGAQNRDLRFKYIAKLLEAPSVVKRTISWLGGDRPAILGKGYLTQHHWSGPNYLEVDVDISSSKVACAICGQVISFAAKVIVEEMFLVEGQAEDELPERSLGTVRYIYTDMAKVPIPLPGYYPDA